MAGSLGSLVVSLGLDAAQYTDGMTKAGYLLNKFADEAKKGVQAAAAVTAASMAAIAASGVAAYEALGQRAEKIGDYMDLADKMGSTAEAVAGLQNAATISGTSLDTVASASVKLTTALAKQDDESKGAGAALKGLGIDVQSFLALDPAAQTKLLADRFADFKDGAEKSAYAVALWGKSGADLIPFLKNLNEEGEGSIRLTQQQIEQADEYQKANKRMQAQISALADVIAAEAAPVMMDLKKALLQTGVEMLGLDDKTSELGKSTDIVEFAERGVQALAFIVDAADGVGRVFSGLGKTIGASAAALVETLSGNAAGAQTIYNELSKDLSGIADRELASSKFAKLREQAKEARRIREEFVGPAAPAATEKSSLDTSFLRDQKKVADDAKALNQARIRETQRTLEEEKALAADRNRILESYNQAGLLSVSDYYTAKRHIAEESTAAQLRAIDQEIAALEKYRASLGAGKDRIEAETKIADAIAKKQRIEQDAGIASIEMSQRETQARQRVADQVSGLNAQLAEYRRNSAEAAAIRFDTGNRQLRDTLTAEGDTESLAKLDTLRQYTVAQAAYNDQALAAQQVQQNLSITENRISIQRQNGLMSEYDALEQLGEARQQAVRDMEATVAAQERLATASENPALILNARAARAELEKLRATADPLGDRFRTIFVESATDSFVDFIAGTKSAKEAFRDFATDVIKQLLRIAAQKAIIAFVTSFFGGTTVGTAGAGTASSGATASVASDGVASGAFSTKGATQASFGEGRQSRDMNVNTTVNVDASSSGADVDTQRQLGGMIDAAVKSVITRESQQGGLLWKQRQGYA